MDDRSENIKMSRSSGASRKNKKRGAKKAIIRTDTWCSEDQTDCPDSSAPPLDYGQIFWQQPGGIPPHLQPHNGQRLFTAMSDPSVCGYSPMPMAYTMEPVSMPPIYPLYRPVPQPNYRPFRGRARRSPQHHQNIPSVINGYSSLQENRTGYSTPNSYQNGDYASLPPTANNEVRRDGEEMNNSEHRRYSDPGLGPADLDNSRGSEDSDSGESGSSITTVGKNNKLVLSLVEQLTNLRESNSRMFKELHETKLSLEHVKAELCRVKQHASMDYQPGMLSDIISEMREANKMLEETMNTRIAAIVEEKYNQRLMEIEGVKERLGKITDDKIDGDRRISKLEEEVARLRINANNEGREIAAFEEETLALRRELQEARSSRHLAENHTIKCVNEVINLPMAPVTFNTPCITSTPVRTDIHIPSDCSVSISSTSSTPLSSLSPSNSSRKMRGINADVVDANWKWQKIKENHTQDLDSKNLETEAMNEKNSRKESVQSLEPDEREALERLINYHLQQEQRLPQENKSKKKNIVRCKSDVLDDTKRFQQRFTSGHNTSNGSTVSSSESDAEKTTGKSKPRRKRGISDIPDVVFATGKTPVPKDPRSTRILTSRVLTAPSRATYTTAYI